MDPEGKHGKVIVLSLKAANEGVLPKNHPFSVGTKYILKVRQQAHATKLLDMKKLFDGTPVEVTAHPTLNYSRCIVNCSEVNDMSQEELLTELAPQGVTAVRRLTRMVDKVKVNTSTMILTMEGTTWPQYIYFGALRVPTRFYYPVPMLCFNCLEYGHTKARCKGASRCQICSAPEHKAEDCKGLTSVIAELKRRPSCQCKKTDEENTSKKEQRNKRAKEISPETTTGTEFRPPPLKKVSSKMNDNTQPGKNIQTSATQPMLEDPIETLNSDTNTEEMSITDNESDRSDTIVINRKGKRKHHRTKNATTNQQ
ncbi:uncharacterized protein LOC131680009 [Topomyia yanbarensis]|uniref:uncharacterized protein LOC131680009 n=1 Tax=Topomyia yanbarensis TaxID=2498891 RepID=UPI00273B5A85|nr:uncharacterized protein LOC131680009 [Topomyia yanbarensis]